MKKIITLVLTVALVATLGITAFAAPTATPSVTPGDSTVAGDTTTALPTVVAETVDGEDTTDIVVSAKSPEGTTVIEDAYKNLDEVKPEGASCRYLFSVSSASGVESEDWGITVRMAVPAGQTVTAAVWNGTEWVQLEVIDNGDGTYTIKGTDLGAVAIFVG